jgi:hypothetical protein
MAQNAFGATGTASDKTTGANIGLGEDKPKILDAQGAIGHAFTGKQLHVHDFHWAQGVSGRHGERS